MEMSTVFPRSGDHAKIASEDLRLELIIARES
jgi:hypothetical protein